MALSSVNHQEDKSNRVVLHWEVSHSVTDLHFNRPDSFSPGGRSGDEGAVHLNKIKDKSGHRVVLKPEVITSLLDISIHPCWQEATQITMSAWGNKREACTIFIRSHVRGDIFITSHLPRCLYNRHFGNGPKKR